MKIILLSILFVMSTAGLIAIIVTLVGRSGKFIENTQETNMFTVTKVNEESLQKVTYELNSKYEGKDGYIEYVGDSYFGYGDPERCVNAWIGQICEEQDNMFIDEVLAEFTVVNSGVSRMVFRDRNNTKRWDASKIDGLLGEPGVDMLSMIDGVGFGKTNDYNFDYSLKDPISGKVMFDTSKRSLIMTDKYLEAGFVLPTQILFGLGQHNSKFLLTEGNWTMFNRDQPGSPEAKGEGKQQLYGTHPFLMAKTPDNKFIGILFYNSNPQTVTISFSKSGRSIINYKTIGGLLDVYFFSSDTADEVIKKYNNLVGKPVLPPFWSLGFHQCSWQYNTTQDLKNVVDQYLENGYIFDTIWSDIMYMDRYIDFTVDAENFTGIKEYINELHSQQRHFVPIVDAGISIEPPKKGTNWYKEGSDMGVFLKTTKNPEKENGVLIAEVWPGYTAFVDFLHPRSDEFWSKGLTELYNLLPFDGIWLDMNEPANFCQENNVPVGECYPNKTISTSKSSLSESPVKPGEFDNTPFKPGGENLYHKTISMDAYFDDPNENGTHVMYNIHNMYGTLETKATFKFLTAPERGNKRPLIISRDSFVGHGQYGSIWTGDNAANENDMRLSINQVMNFNMFGMPFVGGDICGFSDDTNAELCARWAQVGAFYPFMRNHYAINKEPQEFYLFDEKYQAGMKGVIRQRYSLLRYYYTQLFESSAFGEPTVRHPMYDWPEVDEIVKNENTFMIGKAIRITANFDTSTNPGDFKAPFAKGRYLDYNTYEVVEVKKSVEDVTLYNGWDYTNIHIVEGHIVPFQDASEESEVQKSYDLLEDQMRLLIFPTQSGYATGNYLLARGETSDEYHQYYTIVHANKAIQFIFEQGNREDKGTEYNEVVEHIHIVGNETLLNTKWACLLDVNQQFKPLTVEIDQHLESTLAYLKISGGDNTIEFDHTDVIFYGDDTDYNYCDRGYHAYPKQSTDVQKVFTLKKPNQIASNSDLTLSLQLMTDNTIELKITNGGSRFIVPQEALKENIHENYKVGAGAKIDDFVEVSDESSKFTLKIHQYQNPESVYWKIDEDNLIFSDYYLHLKTDVNSNKKLYGLGERVTEFFIQPGTYTSWALDQTDPVDQGKRPGNNIYGTHPVYFTQLATGTKAHWGMFNLNANAQDAKVEFTGDLGVQITHMISGEGIFDMFFFIENPDPETAVKKYHDIIGPTLLPPFWGLGWHQCKYGYNSTDTLKEVYTNYADNDFPMDVLWSDIDHMLKYRDFTFNETGSYAGLGDFIENTLHKENRRYVPIVDAGVAIVNDGSYSVFEAGRKKNVFIKSGNKNRHTNDPIDGMKGILYGKVWPGFAAFPDFTNPDAVQWWVDSIDEFHSKIPFDGLWLDMNEVSNFCDGPCIPEDRVPADESVKTKLVYNPGGRDIEVKSLSIDGVHKEGTELNYHSLFGFLQGVATNKYYVGKKERPFIISRSTFSGQGKYTSHWNGDNHSTLEYLRLGMTGVINMNIYGINFNGADICGFLEETSETLCQRWTNVGAFYPFARNHDDIGNIGQEPYRWSEATQDTMRNAIRWRYALLRYFYTQLYDNHMKGGMFWKPLFFEFPAETHAYDDIERNIMIGPAIKMSAMLDNSTDKTQSFIFPPGLWCNIVSYTCVNPSKTSDLSMPTTPDQLNLHLRMGHIIPLQRDAAVRQGVNNTVELNALAMGIMINVDTKTKKAVGKFFADDGITLDSPMTTEIDFEYIWDGASSATLTVSALKASYANNEEFTKLGRIEIVGATFNKGLDKMIKMKINDGDEFSGTFDSGNNLVYFNIPKPMDITEINDIVFYK